MGLHVSHDCWTGSCGAFNDWRRKLAEALDIGLDLDKMEYYCANGMPWSSLPPDPLHILLTHSDCEGDIAVEHLIPIVDRLEELMPKLKEQDQRCPGMPDFLTAVATTEKFIEGLRLAADLGENVVFK